MVRCYKSAWLDMSYGQSIVKALNKLLNVKGGFEVNLTKGDPRSGFPRFPQWPTCTSPSPSRTDQTRLLRFPPIHNTHHHNNLY
jgi:hypothetical protein